MSQVVTQSCVRRHLAPRALELYRARIRAVKVCGQYDSDCYRHLEMEVRNGMSSVDRKAVVRHAGACIETMTADLESPRTRHPKDPRCCHASCFVGEGREGKFFSSLKAWGAKKATRWFGAAARNLEGSTSRFHTQRFQLPQRYHKGSGSPRFHIRVPHFRKHFFKVPHKGARYMLNIFR